MSPDDKTEKTSTCDITSYSNALICVMRVHTKQNAEIFSGIASRTLTGNADGSCVGPSFNKGSLPSPPP